MTERSETPPQAALALLQQQEVEFYLGPELPNLNDFQFESILDDPLMACIPTETYGGEKKLNLSDLARFPLILLNRKTAVRGLLDRLTAADMLAIGAVSALVPMLGNLGLALFLDRARRLLQSPAAMRRLNIGSGVLLIGVGLTIPFL